MYTWTTENWTLKNEETGAWIVVCPEELVATLGADAETIKVWELLELPVDAFGVLEYLDGLDTLLADLESGEELGARPAGRLLPRVLQAGVRRGDGARNAAFTVGLVRGGWILETSTGFEVNWISDADRLSKDGKFLVL